MAGSYPDVPAPRMQYDRDGSTGFMIDTERDLTFIFLSAGFVEGMAHIRRLERLADLAIAAIRD